MFYYDSDFHRQRQQERVAELRDEYRRAQAQAESRASAQVQRAVRSAWSRLRWVIPRRAPVYRA